MVFAETRIKVFKNSTAVWLGRTIESRGRRLRETVLPGRNIGVSMLDATVMGAPLEGDALEAAQTKYKLEDDLRNAIQAKDAAGIKAGIGAINTTRKAGEITPDEQTKLTTDAYKFKTRLAATIVRLPLDDALDVYKAASNIEKKQIRTAVLTKVQGYYNEVNRGKKPMGEYRSLQPRILKFLSDKP